MTPARRRAATRTARLVLLHNAPLAAVFVAGVGLLWLVRPGVVTNGARSPLLWLAVAAAVVAAKMLGLLVRSLTGRTAAGTAASVAVGLLASYVLLAPSFQQRTLEEPFPVVQPLAAAPQVATPRSQSSPEPAVQPPAPSAQPRKAAPAQPSNVAPAQPPNVAPAQPSKVAAAPPPAAPQSRQAPDGSPDRPAEASAPPPRPAPAPPSSEPRTPAPAAASAALQVSAAQLEGVGHSASGRTAFYEVDGGKVLRFEDVDIEGTPGPVVHLVPRGARSPAGGVRIGELKAEKGTFSYRLPSSVDVRQGWTVLVWCEPYDTPIAAADH